MPEQLGHNCLQPTTQEEEERKEKGGKEKKQRKGEEEQRKGWEGGERGRRTGREGYSYLQCSYTNHHPPSSPQPQSLRLLSLHPPPQYNPGGPCKGMELKDGLKAPDSEV